MNVLMLGVHGKNLGVKDGSSVSIVGIVFAWNGEEGRKMRPFNGKINEDLVTEPF